MQGAMATLRHEIGITIEVQSAELQHIPLFKGLNQQLPLEVGQYVGLASADGPMHLARVESTGEPGFWYANAAMAPGPAAVELLRWGGILDFSIQVEEKKQSITTSTTGATTGSSGGGGGGDAAAAAPAPAPSDGGGGWGWGGAWAAVSSVASTLVGADEEEPKDPMKHLKELTAARLKEGNAPSDQ